MAFGIETNTNKPDEGELKGKQETIACDCWFTSSGSTLPRFIKYQDYSGEIHSIGNIHVYKVSKKRYCGITVMEYVCSALENDHIYEFKLLFHLEACKWKIIW